jgi:hypothetical protein
MRAGWLCRGEPLRSNRLVRLSSVRLQSRQAFCHLLRASHESDARFTHVSAMRGEGTAMAGRKRRKRRAHRAQRGATTRSKTRPSPAAPIAARPCAEQEASPARLRSRHGAAKEIRETLARTSLPVMSGVARLGPLATALLPARGFFAMGRPVPGLVCCILQASLLGWLPAALWAFRAERRVTLKHRGLAARLRPL